LSQNDHDYVPFFVIIIWPFPYWWPISGFVTRVLRQVPHARSELLILPEHMSSSPVFARSVGLYILFAHHCVSFCPLSFGHCIISSSCWRLLITTLVSSSNSSSVICRGFCLWSLFVLLKFLKVLTIMFKLSFYCIVLFLILIPRIFCP
jgi:hypothetical protein